MDRCMNGIGIHSTYLKLLLKIWNFSSQIVIYYEFLLCGMQRLYSVLCLSNMNYGVHCLSEKLAVIL